MLVTSGIIALSRKIQDNRAKKAAEAKAEADALGLEGHQSTTGATARRNVSSTSQQHGSRGRCSLHRQRPSGTSQQLVQSDGIPPSQSPRPRYEGPESIGTVPSAPNEDSNNTNSGNTGASSGILSPGAQVRDARSPPPQVHVNVSSPVHSESASPGVASPGMEDDSLPTDFESRLAALDSSEPPPPAYSERPDMDNGDVLVRGSEPRSTSGASLSPRSSRQGERQQRPQQPIGVAAGVDASPHTPQQTTRHASTASTATTATSSTASSSASHNRSTTAITTTTTTNEPRNSIASIHDNSIPDDPPLSPRSSTSSTTTASSSQRHVSGRLSHSTNTTSSSSSSTGEALRIRTRGAELKSGFPYHPKLFDLHVHPSRWEKFTAQIVEATKMGLLENARAWGSGAGIALTTGAIGTSVFVGRSVHRHLQEKKVVNGLTSSSTNSLGTVLDQWNERYFMNAPMNLFVHLELSESALKHADQRSRTFRRPAFTFDSPAERERKREERKYVLVVSRLDADGLPNEVLQEAERAVLEEEQRRRGSSDGDGLSVDDEATTGAVEIGSSEIPDGTTSVAELPGDFSKHSIAELPAEEVHGPVSLGYGNEKAAPPVGLAELDGSATATLQGEDHDAQRSWYEEGDDYDEEAVLRGSRPGRETVMVNAETHAMLHDERSAG